MKRISASFYSKGYMAKYNLEAAVRRLYRDINGQLMKDVGAVSVLNANEYACDDITIKVFGKSRTDVVATAKAYYMQVCAVGGGPLNTSVYKSAREVGSMYASLQLNRQRLAFACYDRSLVTVLVVEHIEVAPEHRRERIATSIMDFLLHTMPADYVASTVLPLYTPTVDKTVVSPAATNVDVAERFLESLGYRYGGAVKIDYAGTPTPAHFYSINQERA